MKNITIYQIFTFVVLTSLCQVSLAKIYQAKEIESFAQQTMEDYLTQPEIGRLEIKVGELDPRIQIKPCDTQLEANIPEKKYSRNVNIKIYCEGTIPWQLYLPVKIRNIVPTVVAKHQISKGTLINEDNITVKEIDISRIHGQSISDVAEVIGTKAKRNISQNKRITHKNICFVCKGQSVTLIAQSASFSLKTRGIALENGSTGDEIKVKNQRSGRTVLGQVKSINKVVINL